MGLLSQVFQSPETEYAAPVRSEIREVFMAQLQELEYALSFVASSVHAQEQDEATPVVFDDRFGKPMHAAVIETSLQQPTHKIEPASQAKPVETTPQPAAEKPKEKTIAELQAHIDLLYENLDSDPVRSNLLQRL